MSKKRIVVYGAGNLFLRLKKDILKKYDIAYICDRKFGENDVEYEGIKIIKINELYKFSEVYICIENYSVAREIQEDFNLRGVSTYMLREELNGIVSLSSADIKRWFPNGYSDDRHNVIKWKGDLPNDFVVMFYGKNNCLDIGEANEFFGVTFKLGNEGGIKIGKNVIINETYDIVASNGKITIGNDCIVGGSVMIHTCNGHHIFSLKDKKRICEPSDVKIGNHVWLGREVILFGGADIGDGSIMGARAVTSSKIDRNVIAVGSPARVIRRDIVWNIDSELLYNHKMLTECVEPIYSSGE